MNVEWPEIRLEDVTSILGDGLHGTPEYDDAGEYCFINGNNLDNGQIVFTDKTRRASKSEYLKHKKDLNDKTILVSINGTIGNVALYNGEKVLLGKSACYFNVKEGVDRQFIRYVISSGIFQNYIHSLATGSTIKNVSLKLMRDFTFRLPPFPIQKKISEILGNLDEKILLNRQTNQNLEQIAQAIFKSWFVDFEPVRAKAWVKALELPQRDSEQAQSLAAQAILCGAITLEQLQELTSDVQTLPQQLQTSIDQHIANQPGLTNWSPQQLQTTAELFSSKLVESELGEVPERWCWSEIGNEVTVVGGGTPSTNNEEFWEDGHIHWTTPKDLSNLNDKILLETERKITKKGLAKISSGLLPVNTVLMSSRAPVGYLAISKIPVAINQGYIAMKCEAVLTPEYVIQWADSVMSDIKQRASGTTFEEISKKNFRTIPVVVPDQRVIGEYSKVISYLYGMISILIRESTCLREIRDGLLPKLLTGDIELAG